MKSNSLNGCVRKKIFLSLVTLGFCLTNVTPSYSYESSPELKEELLKVEIPNIPNLKNPDLYLYTPEEVFTVKLILKLASKQVQVYEQDRLVASFPVAVGKKGWETPVGEFQIIQMIENPSWQNPWTGKVTPPSPNGPLGERWIGFWTDGKNFIGFHGTPGEHLIGQAVSHGCVRMKNKDIKELFKLVSLGIPVTVVNN
ncbi:L,D-transpeptidase [Geminocystis sp. GBBB08]|uniref:L,D-transpeptidase n=1 Tax=Geminocystis sp. GBBB08 TaxID=2604140 RepID=UPI0027E3A0B9|nr:L,D-transpeptidase [Geminocystis sp. GBBB08]MBL1209317.1 L,D-transpeptidase [Geminocystis sp. GBBB08]